MKQPITFRLEPSLLAEAREQALRENRSLTNYIETALKRYMASVCSQDEAISLDNKRAQVAAKRSG
jgi:hypothetical protein